MHSFSVSYGQILNLLQESRQFPSFLTCPESYSEPNAPSNLFASVELRAMLQKLEQSLDPAEDAEALAELKRIILRRISELDAAEGLEQGVVETANRNEDAAPLEEHPRTAGA